MPAKTDPAKTVLVASVAVLLGIGAVMIFSTTARGDGSLVSSTFVKQMIYVAMGLAAAIALARTDYHVITRHNRVILVVALVLLVLVLVPGIGVRINGARRWIRVGPIGFQPSEFAKLALLIWLAAFLAGKGDGVRSFKSAFAPVLVVVAAACALILKEPDIGTSILLFAVAWIVLFAAGSRLVYLCAPIPAAVPLLFFLVSRGYAKERIDAWIDPWKDPAQSGYHIIQSLIAIGSGGTWGVGLGASTQKLFFLPEASTDFIFAVLAEELGLVGVTVVLVLYAAFVWAGASIARRAPDAEGMLLASGITSLIALQALINIGVVTQVLPTKGIPLPFISAGGSAAVFMLMGVGILYSIARSANAEAAE